MLNIILPDGNKLNFNKKVTGLEIAEKISKSLSKSALLISIDGKLKELNTEDMHPIEQKYVDTINHKGHSYSFWFALFFALLCPLLNCPLLFALVMPLYMPSTDNLKCPLYILPYF